MITTPGGPRCTGLYILHFQASTSYNLSLAYFELPMQIAYCKFQMTDSKLKIVNFHLQIANYTLPIANSHVNCLLQIEN